jgi:hypothetical protein
MSKSNEVWSATLDGKYVVTVTSEAPCRGILTITGGEKVLDRESVGLIYNAQFGPDVEDVALWQETTVRIFDGRE